MLIKLIDFLTTHFSKNDQAALEKYILSKNPTNTAELEHWINEYTYRQQGWKL